MGVFWCWVLLVVCAPAGVSRRGNLLLFALRQLFGATIAKVTPLVRTIALTAKNELLRARTDDNPCRKWFAERIVDWLDNIFRE